MIKRGFDLLCATLGLMCLAPFFVLIALWIRLDSAGPIFFRQERVGRGGRLFRIHKFRTMRTDSEQGGQLTIGQDSRITGSGHFLRKFKLDELPQLMDVIQGTMSLVGPRPEVPRYVACYPAEVRERVLSVRPGITDLASIEFKDESSILGASSDPEKDYVDKILPLKLAYYTDYVSRQSLWLDIRIILRTLSAIVFR